MKTWREYFAPRISAVLHEHPKDTPERKKALREVWNAGERAHWPYKVYLDEIARQTGKKPNPIRRDKKNRPAPGQLSLINNFVEG